MSRRAAALLLATLACGRSAPLPNGMAAPPAEEPPVALNAEPVVQYPPDLYDQRIEGEAVLRLFADSTGRLVPESTRVAESSGHAALDSAAVKGVARLQYAPARRHGLPVATTFLQSVEFRQPGPKGASSLEAPDRRPGRADSNRVRANPAKPRPDSSRAPRDTGPVRPDSNQARPDTAGARPDSTQARPDTNGAAR